MPRWECRSSADLLSVAIYLVQEIFEKVNIIEFLCNKGELDSFYELAKSHSLENTTEDSHATHVYACTPKAPHEDSLWML